MSSLLEYLVPDFLINKRYRIARRIGAGGFAVVFEAFDVQIDRKVAIKVLHTGLSHEDPEVQKTLMERFEREAKLAARVDHPNVVSIYDFGIIEERLEPFIVMELLKGHDLDVHLRKHGAMNPEHIIPLYIDCLNALGVAHSHGIVHKDLKPSNLFLKNPGERFESLCIVDFGIAHINEAFRRRLTQDGQLLGTPDYLAPEYITDRKVSAAMDVYQMALILVECLIGEPVVQHPDHLVAMLKHVRGDVHVPRALLRSELGPVLRRAMAYEPEQRYSNALEFADALAIVDLGSLPKVRASDPRDPVNDASGDWASTRDSGEMAVKAALRETLHDQSPSTPNPAGAMAAVVEATAPAQTLLDVPAAPTPGRLTQFENLSPADEDGGWGDEERKSSKSPGLLVAGVLIVVILAGVAFFALKSSSGEDAGASDVALSAPQPNVPEVPVAPIAPEPAPPVEPPRVEPPAEPPAPAKNTVQVLVLTDPAGARVFEGDVELGATPLPLSFGEDAPAERRLRLEQEGFQSKDVLVSASNAPQSFSRLEPVVAKPAAAPVKAPRVHSPPRRPPSESSRKAADAILLP